MILSKENVNNQPTKHYSEEDEEQQNQLRIYHVQSSDLAGSFF
jgi:hypothetical protein